MKTLVLATDAELERELRRAGVALGASDRLRRKVLGTIGALPTDSVAEAPLTSAPTAIVERRWFNWLAPAQRWDDEASRPEPRIVAGERHRLGPPIGRSPLAVVEGCTLEDVIATLHSYEHQLPAAATMPLPSMPLAEPEPLSPSPWTLDGALALLVQVARAVGTAHSRGVVHLDLKPNNIIFDGRHLIPRIIDWDLAPCLDRPRGEAPNEPPAGVIPFMAPEQLVAGAVGRRCDVYALGALMYTLITGRPPFANARAGTIRETFLAGRQVPSPMMPADGTEWDQCRAVCQAALALDPDQRPADGGQFADALEAALAQREMSLINDWLRAAEDRRKEAAVHARDAVQRLRQIKPWHLLAARRDAWRAEDRAAALLAEADQDVAQWEEAVRALSYRMPWLPEPHAALARHHVEQFLAAERLGDTQTAQRMWTVLRGAGERIHASLARATTSAPAEVLRLLASIEETHGIIDVVTEPAGARVQIARLIAEGSLWKPGPFREAGVTPLYGVREPWGPCLVRLTAPGRVPVLLPMHIMRGPQLPEPPPWGGDAIPLPPASLLGEDDVYVPRGWFRAGGVSDAVNSISARSLWIDGFVMKRNPVTHQQYIDFLDALLAKGAHAALETHMPSVPDTQDGGQSLYRQNEAGHHVLIEPERDLDEPVSRIGWASAAAYATWYAAQTGRPWRLPSEWEYEKAARGVDGRRCPWGDHFEPWLTHVANSQPVIHGPLPVHAPTHDVSVYGIRWLAGNMRTWCLEAWSLGGPPDGSRVRPEVAAREAPGHYQIVRGGAYASLARTVSSATRFADPPTFRMPTVGLRLVHSYPMEDDDSSDPQ